MSNPHVAAMLALGLVSGISLSGPGPVRPARKTANPAKKRARKAKQKARRKQR